ncbi:hypothetical protein GHK86_11575, partial [Acidimicrobiaceae bacterium USS-CC1]|nr:hypothetical protein [Acidiferrimicrobium australe]
MELREVPGGARRGGRGPLPPAGGARVRRGRGGDRGGAPRLIPVDDPDDPRLDAYRELRDAALRRRLEAREGVFVAEGHLAATRLLESAYPVVSLLVAEGKGAALPDLVRAVEERGAPVYVAAPEVLARTVGFDLHRGVVALGRRLPPVPVDAVAAGPGPLLVAEGLNDHENLGALFR